MRHATTAALMYHEVTDDPSSSGFQRPAARPYTLSRSAFAAHLDAVATGPLQPTLVTRVDLSRPGRHLFLTFDDGGVSAMHTAEALSHRGWLGHFFVITGRVGERTFLQPSDLRTLRSWGHVVGTHSHTHPDIFSDLPPQRMETEWQLSRTVLEAWLGEPCVTGSVPGGDLSPTVVEAAAAVGLTHLFTSEPTLAPSRVFGTWVLGRLCIKRSVPAEDVADLVRLRGWRRAQVERRLKVLARRSLGPMYRMYVQHITTPLHTGTRESA